MTVTISSIRRRSLLIGTALMIATATTLTLAVPGTVQADSPAAALRLKAKPKPHMSLRPTAPRPQGPANLKGHVPELADWYCGEGSGPGGHAVCTKDLIASCSGTYVPPKTNGEHQTWGMCHESSG
jgi:hypothetical protein